MDSSSSSSHSLQPKIPSLSLAHANEETNNEQIFDRAFGGPEEKNDPSPRSAVDGINSSRGNSSVVEHLQLPSSQSIVSSSSSSSVSQVSQSSSSSHSLLLRRVKPLSEEEQALIEEQYADAHRNMDVDFPSPEPNEYDSLTGSGGANAPPQAQPNQQQHQQQPQQQQLQQQQPQQQQLQQQQPQHPAQPQQQVQPLPLPAVPHQHQQQQQQQHQHQHHHHQHHHHQHHHHQQVPQPQPQQQPQQQLHQQPGPLMIQYPRGAVHQQQHPADYLGPQEAMTELDPGSFYARFITIQSPLHQLLQNQGLTELTFMTNQEYYPLDNTHRFFVEANRFSVLGCVSASSAPLNNIYHFHEQDQRPRSFPLSQFRTPTGQFSISRLCTTSSKNTKAANGIFCLYLHIDIDMGDVPEATSTRTREIFQLAATERPNMITERAPDQFSMSMRVVGHNECGRMCQLFMTPEIRDALTQGHRLVLLFQNLIWQHMGPAGPMKFGMISTTDGRGVQTGRAPPSVIVAVGYKHAVTGTFFRFTRPYHYNGMMPLFDMPLNRQNGTFA